MWFLLSVMSECLDPPSAQKGLLPIFMCTCMRVSVGTWEHTPSPHWKWCEDPFIWPLLQKLLGFIFLHLSCIPESDYAKNGRIWPDIPFLWKGIQYAPWFPSVFVLKSHHLVPRPSVFFSIWSKSQSPWWLAAKFGRSRVGVRSLVMSNSEIQTISISILASAHLL